jgi:hypothetical protein
MDNDVQLLSDALRLLEANEWLDNVAYDKSNPWFCPFCHRKHREKTRNRKHGEDCEWVRVTTALRARIAWLLQKP